MCCGRLRWATPVCARLPEHHHQQSLVRVRLRLPEILWILTTELKLALRRDSGYAVGECAGRRRMASLVIVGRTWFYGFARSVSRLCSLVSCINISRALSVSAFGFQIAEEALSGMTWCSRSRVRDGEVRHVRLRCHGQRRFRPANPKIRGFRLREWGWLRGRTLAVL